MVRVLYFEPITSVYEESPDFNQKTKCIYYWLSCYYVFLLFIQHKNEIWHLKAWSVKKLKGNKLLRVWHSFTTFELVYIEQGGNDPDVTHLILRMNELFSRVVTVFIILNITFSFLNWLKYAQNRLLPYNLFKIDYYWDIVLL